MVELTTIGHAGLRIEASHFSMLLDPWASRYGAFQSSWYQFPRNDHLDFASWLNADWVAVSHEHLDHMDGSILARLSPHTRVLIPSYPAKAFRERLERMGVSNIIELRAWDKFPLDTKGSWITAIPEQSPMCHDAAFLVAADGFSVLDCNDARLSIAQGKRASLEVGGHLDVVAIQYSGASWHPICYEYPSSVIREIEDLKRQSKLRAVLRFLRGVGPKQVIPFAGPPCFLDESLRRFNASIERPGVFPHQEYACEWLAGRLKDQELLAMRPGDRLHFTSGRVDRDPVSAVFDYATLETYIDAYAEDRKDELATLSQRYPSPGPDLADRFAEHFTHLGSLSPWFLRQIGMTVRFEVRGDSGGIWDVSMRHAGLHVDLKGGDRKAQYGIRIDSRWLSPVLLGQIGWEDLFLSLRLSAWREPDIYNDYLVGLLKHANAPALQAVEDYEASRGAEETIRLTVSGREIRVGRFCPHAGEDLSEGAVLVGDRLRCLGHGFEFDLKTGECVNAKCSPLPVMSMADSTPKPKL